MTKDEALRLTLEALKTIDEAMPFPVAKLAIKECKAALEAKDEPLTPDDTVYRPNGLPQEFIKHEVESPDDWSEWVCPDPDEYFMKCCDCGLVHEVQYRVARYGEGDYCELVEDKDVQAQFRMRRRTSPQRKPLTDEEIEKMRHLIDWTAHWSYNTFARAIEAAHGIKREAK